VKSEFSKNPIAAFELPPYQPAAVAELKANFDDLGTKYANLVGEIQDAEQEAVDATAQDLREAADAYAAGKEPGDPNKRQREAHAKTDALKQQLIPLSVAVHEVGNALAAAVGSNCNEWISELEQADVALCDRFETAIAEALDVLAELKPVRGATGWLRDFDAGEATIAKQGSYHGGHLRVRSKGHGPVRGEYDPADLIELAGKITHPPEPTTRTETWQEARFESVV
jgi:hypothetical protein